MRINTAITICGSLMASGAKLPLLQHPAAACGLALVVLLFCWLMFQIIYPYALGQTDTFFLQDRTERVDWLRYRWAFYAHIFPALLLLSAGVTQFSGSILRRTPGLHRSIGKVYVHGILWFSAPAAAVMAVFANGGAFTQLAFLCQSILWWVFTFLAWRSIRKKAYWQHGIWMIRSYALTTAAVTLRAMQWGFALYSNIPSAYSYQLVAWPSWLLNLTLAEIVLAIYAARRKPPVERLKFP